MTDKTITPGEALWILNNIPTQPPHGVMPAAWINHRGNITAKLQRIVDSAREANYQIIDPRQRLEQTKGTPQ